MKTKSIVAFLLIVLVVTQVQFAVAQKADKSFDGWTLLGTRKVDYTLDRDVVSLKEGGQEIYTSLKFVVKNGTINMHKCSVHFKDGETKEIEFADQVSKDNDGRIMQLTGNKKAIEKVTFWYDTKNSSDNKSIVEIWGKQ